jgi:DNA polymerase-3 subunit beta
MQHDTAISSAIISRPTVLVDFAPFLMAATIAANTAEKRNHIPILSNVRISGDGESIRFVTTDMDMECVYRIPAAADSRFDVTIPAHYLADAAKKTKRADMVAIDQHGDDVTMDWGGPVNTVLGLPVADFPSIPRPAAWSSDFILPTASLRMAFGKTEFAISTEETRYYLNGVFLEAFGDRLRFVATDGHRLVQYDLPAPEGSETLPVHDTYSGEKRGVILPAKLIRDWLKATKAKGTDSTTRVKVSASAIEITTGPVAYLSKLIDGTFPAYDRVIPRDNDKAIQFGRDDFATMVRGVSAMSSERGRAVRLVICPEGITGEVSNPETGKAAADMILDDLGVGFDGGPMAIGFNARYLLDFTKILGERVEMRLFDPGSPALILDRTDSAFVGVLMPMRV